MKTLQQVKNELKEYDGKEIKIMEVCGTHTSSIFKNGIRSLISPKIKLISGPGCPVCVTPASFIDKLAEYSFKENCCVLTFGDMMKVKGTQMSLTEAKAAGGNVRVLYSPLSACKIAAENSKMEFVFASVGFETTAPIYGIIIDELTKKKIKNLKLLVSLKTIIPALSFICENEKNIDGFLCPGHASVILGSSIYGDLVEKYNKPFVVAGFEGEHIIAAIYEIMSQLKNNKPIVKNLYTSTVSGEGNQKALGVINKYFEVTDDCWRGIGVIKDSGLKLRKEYMEFDAGSGFNQNDIIGNKEKGCRCTDVILGRINPIECPLFRKACTPLNAVGPCMVSSEGSCGIWYKNGAVK